MAHLALHLASHLAPRPLTLEQLNAATADEFTVLLDGTYEHSPWIARAA